MRVTTLFKHTWIKTYTTQILQHNKRSCVLTNRNPEFNWISNALWSCFEANISACMVSTINHIPHKPMFAIDSLCMCVKPRIFPKKLLNRYLSYIYHISYCHNKVCWACWCRICPARMCMSFAVLFMYCSTWHEYTHVTILNSLCIMLYTKYIH